MFSASAVPDPNQSSLPQAALVVMGNIGHTPHLALALQEAGLLKRWYTALYYKPDQHNLIKKFLPGLSRRYHRDIDSGRVHTIPGWELFRLAVFRLPFVSDSLKWRVMRSCAERFATSVASHLSRYPVDIIVGVNYSSLEIFQLAGQMGAMTILSQRTQHPITQQQVFETELRRRGIVRHRFLEEHQHRSVRRRIEEIELADYIFCPSQSVIDSMQANGVPTRKLILIPFGVDLTRFNGIARQQSDEKLFRLLYVGRVGYTKGIAYLVEAFRQLALPNSELVLVGGLDGVKALVPEFKPPIFHAGWMPPAELDKYYLSASAFVLPSLSEGSALVCYEAMAAGLPVIATSASGAVVLDGEDGLIVPPADVDALKKSITCLYENPVLRRQMGKRAQQHIQDFSWERYRRQIAETIRELRSNERD